MELEMSGETHREHTGPDGPSRYVDSYMKNGLNRGIAGGQAIALTMDQQKRVIPWISQNPARQMGLIHMARVIRAQEEAARATVPRYVRMVVGMTMGTFGAKLPVRLSRLRLPECASRVQNCWESGCN